MVLTQRGLVRAKGEVRQPFEREPSDFFGVVAGSHPTPHDARAIDEEHDARTVHAAAEICEMKIDWDLMGQKEAEWMGYWSKNIKGKGGN